MMVDISKYYESNFVSVEYVKTLGEEERKATIIGVGEEAKFSGYSLWKIPVQFNLSKDIKDVTLNYQSWEFLKQSFGTDTSGWLAKQVLFGVGVNTKGTEVVFVKPINI